MPHLNENTKEERRKIMSREKIIMIKLTELLSQENLISPDEYARLLEKIRKDEI